MFSAHGLSICACGDDDDDEKMPSGGEGQDGGVPDGGLPDDRAFITAGGSLLPLPAYEDLAASGSALLVRSAAGAQFSLQVNGLTPNLTYQAHLHGLPCALEGGGHYKIDPTLEETSEANELWLQVTTDDMGEGFVLQDFGHTPREDGMSVVLHDVEADQAKMLCADLSFGDTRQPPSATGRVAPFAQASEAEGAISGSVRMEVMGEDLVIGLALSGLDPEADYVAHVHALPCEVDDGDGHYKLDPSIEATEEANELWVVPEPDANGEAAAEKTFPGADFPRDDAQSLVVHRRVPEGMALKVACGNLERNRAVPYEVGGPGQLLEAAAGQMLSGEGTIRRGPAQETVVQLQVEGAEPMTDYMAHVHDRPCGVREGGAHFRFDREVTETLEDNEVWLPVSTDGDGRGVAEVHTAQILPADAQSIVLHGPDGNRLLCF